MDPESFGFSGEPKSTFELVFMKNGHLLVLGDLLCVWFL